MENAIALPKWAGYHKGTSPPWLRPHKFDGSKPGPGRPKGSTSMRVELRRLFGKRKDLLDENGEPLVGLRILAEALFAEMQAGNMVAWAFAKREWPDLFDQAEEAVQEAIGMPQTQKEAAQLEHQASMVLTELGRLGFGKRELEASASKP